MNKDVLSSLFVGIDVSSATNEVCAMDFHQQILLKGSFVNDYPNSEFLVEHLLDCLDGRPDLTNIIFVIESTSVYSFHIANFLAANNSLFNFKSQVFVINPKTSSNFKKTYIDEEKTDPIDAFHLADMARCGRIGQEPWRASQLFALQRLTRQRFHLVQTIMREKAYMLTNIYIKFSSLAVCDKDDKPFSNMFGATARSVISDLSPDDIVNMSDDDLVNFIMDKGKGRFSNPEEVVTTLKKAARASFRLDKVAYEPINVAIASSMNTIEALAKNLKLIDAAIEKNVKGLCEREYTILRSIPGIGPVFAAGIISEIESSRLFKDNNALAKYAGLTWRKHQSGKFEADTTYMTKSGNKYLRYYLIEAVSRVRLEIPEFQTFYTKKYNEVHKTQHKRALALTARKFVRLIFGLLHHNQLYIKDKGVNLTE